MAAMFDDIQCNFCLPCTVVADCYIRKNSNACFYISADISIICPDEERTPMPL